MCALCMIVCAISCGIVCALSPPHGRRREHARTRAHSHTRTTHTCTRHTRTVGVVEVVPPQRAQLLLAADVPDREDDVLVLHFLDVEALGVREEGRVEGECVCV